jgi:catechol 2,3-dioxygenase-like lactoylglutathione lyase family enzyme
MSGATPERGHGRAGVLGVWHTGFSVEDIEVSIRFWTEGVGLVLRHRQIQENPYTSRLVGYPDVRLSVAQLRLPDGDAGVSGHVLELIEYQRPRGTRVDPQNARIGSGHICIAVADIDPVRQRCEALGAVFLSETQDITAGVNAGGRAVYGQAPDGITFELLQPPAVPGTPRADRPRESTAG